MTTQDPLVGLAPALPAGLLLVPEALDVDDEAALVERCAALPLEAARYKGFVARRRVASFGLAYDFERNAACPAPPIPAFLAPVVELAARHAGHAADAFVQALVAEYRPGTELGWHRDVPDFGTVVGVSLASACRMRLRPWPPPPRTRATLDVWLEPRSLYVLRGAARWRWQHAIAPTPELRYSVTLRTGRGEGGRAPPSRALRQFRPTGR